jgi:hypothetical protein
MMKKSDSWFGKGNLNVIEPLSLKRYMVMFYAMATVSIAFIGTVLVWPERRVSSPLRSVAYSTIHCAAGVTKRDKKHAWKPHEGSPFTVQSGH